MILVTKSHNNLQELYEAMIVDLGCLYDWFSANKLSTNAKGLLRSDAKENSNKLNDMLISQLSALNYKHLYNYEVAKYVSLHKR